MKKSFEKFLAIATGTLNILFLVLIGLVIYKKIDVGQLDNQVLVTLLSVLGAINIVLLGFIITNAFIDRDTLAAVLLFSDKSSSTKAGINVVKKIVRRSAKQLGNIKVTKTALFLEENNGLRMRIAVKIKEDQVEHAVDKFRCLLIDEFSNILEIEFNSIDFKVTALKTNYRANLGEVEKQARQIQEDRAAKAAKERERKLIEEQAEQAQELADEVIDDFAELEDTEQAEEIADQEESEQAQANSEAAEPEALNDIKDELDGAIEEGEVGSITTDIEEEPVADEKDLGPDSNTKAAKDKKE